MSLIMDELVWVVCTATPCHRNALARRAENVLLSYCLCHVATWAVLRILVSSVRLGRSGCPAHFRRIVTAKAGWELSNARTIDAFRSGLRPGTLNAIMNRDVWPDTMPQWQQAAWDEMCKYLTKKAILSFRPQMGNQGSLGTRNQWQHRFGQHRQGGGSSSRDPNAMDVNAISTQNPLSEEEKKQLMAEGRCFFCKQQGHML
jgi:hypothetical protein